MLRQPPRTSPGRPAGSSKLLRAMNDSAALAYLLDRGTLTRGDLRQLTGLSKPTTSDVLRRLTDTGLAIVVGHTRGGPGPHAEIYAANPAAAYVAALSVRGTGEPSRPDLAGALLDLAGTVHARTHDTVDLSTVSPLDAITGLVGRLAEHAGVEGSAVSHVHVGVPGSYDAGEDVIRHIDITGFGRPGLVADLSERLGATVQVENDVNLAAIAERARGVGAGCDGFALVWFGEGLGLAIDLDGRLVRGARGRAGEIGYVPVGFGRPPADLQSLAGGAAVAELAVAHGLTAASPGEVADRTAVAERATAHGLSTTAPGEIADRTAAAERATAHGLSTTAPGEIADRTAAAERATAHALTAASPGEWVGAAVAAGNTGFLDAIAARIAQCVAVVAGVLDPPLVVLAGEVAQAGGEDLAERVRAAIASATPLDIRIAVTAIAEDAVLLGAVDAGLRAVRDELISDLRAGLSS